MALRDSLHRALVFSGLVEDQPHTTSGYLRRPAPEPVSLPASLPLISPVASPPTSEAPEQDPVQAPTGGHGAEHDEQIVVRRLGAAADAPQPGAEEIDAIFATGEAVARPSAPPLLATPPARSAPTTPTQPPPREVSVLRVSPRSFNDAQLVADRFKAATPVILDLQGVESDLAKRLVGFASGLTYGLDGGMGRLEQRVFLLTPRGVEIPPAQRARLVAQGSLKRI